MAKFLFAAVAATSMLAHAEPAAKDPVHPFDDYGPAMESTAAAPLLAVWQKQNAAAIDEATAEGVVAGIVANHESAKAFLAKLRGAYGNDPLVLIQLAAVSQWVMGKDPSWFNFMSPRPSAGRKVWVRALVETAETASDPYVAQLCLDQLRWCGCSCKKLRDRVQAIGRNSSDKGVKDLAEMVESTLK